MKLTSHRRPPTAAFTMVELALCIAIVAFAMVAILGVLPLGLNVQKQNREDTIIDQEGPMWVDLIRRGGIGWEDVTNYVDFILVERTPVNRNGATITNGFRGPFYSSQYVLPPPNAHLTTAAQVVGLLSLPRFEVDQGTIYSNRVTAVCRSVSGDFNSLIRPDRSTTFTPTERQLDDSFRYQIQVELTPVAQLPTLEVAPTNLVAQAGLYLGGYLNALRLDTNLIEALNAPVERTPARDLFTATVYDLKLVFRWPVFRVGGEITLGPGRRVLRTQVLGRPRFAIFDPNNVSSVYWPMTSIRPRHFDTRSIHGDLTR